MVRFPKVIVIDTIPLLLFLIGAYDKTLISTFKRLKTYNYTFEDFTILKEFLLHTNKIIVTPGVLSEVSNYAYELEHFSDLLETNIHFFLMFVEEFYVSKNIILASKDELFKFGFTDTSLIIAAKTNDGEILTRDYKLSQYCQKKLGIGAHNLDDILKIKELFK
ncbi:MAG: hypothetical protein O8C62_07550 [Candidatus Methanoperedens sp.]|nr:hypothetical protein [Candidatus Methanoperedens sp.]